MCNYNDHDENLIEAVWRKGCTVPGNNPNVWRKDVCGAWMKREDYDNRNSEYGWQIDHINPASRGGSHDIENLRPLHWLTNESRQNQMEDYCRVRAHGNHNVRI